MSNLLTQAQHQTQVRSKLLENPIFAKAAEERNWLVYELRDRPGKKPAKIPVTKVGGGAASKDVAAQWTLDQVLHQLDEGFGVGYLPREGSALVGVDIDGCVEDGEIEDYADNMIGNAYTEVSPSGTGLRCLLPRKKGDHWFREPGGTNPLGFFGSDGRFFTVTFNSIWEPEDTFLEDDGVMRAEIAKHLGTSSEKESNKRSAALKRVSKRVKTDRTSKHWFFGLDTDEQLGCMGEVLSHFDAEPDETWYRVGMSMKSLDTDWAWGLFDAWSSEAPNYDLVDNEKRWNSFKADGDLTFRTLFKEAKDAGWDEGEWRDPVQFSEITGELFVVEDGRIPEDQPWLLEGWLRAHGNAGFAGQSGVGKTTLSGTWVAAMIDGRTELVGLPPAGRPLNVAWMNAEEESSTLRHQVEAARQEFGLERNGKLIVAGTEALDISEDGLSLVVKKRNTEEHFTDLVVNEALVDKIVEALKEAEIDVMIIDPITEFNDGNENDRGDAKKLNRAITLIAQRSGCATVVWSHTGQMPEAKKPDWYKDDLYSQRGSSQNVGALKTFGTLFPLMPTTIAKSDEARRYYADVKTGNKPNVIMLKQLKVKNYPRLTSVAYRLRPSKYNPDYAVAELLDLDQAQNLVNGTFDAVRNVAVVAITKELVKSLGEGAHKRTTVNKRMEESPKWPAKELRSDVKKHREFLEQWEHGIVVTVDKQEWRVNIEIEEGAAFTVMVQAC